MNKKSMNKKLFWMISPLLVLVGVIGNMSAQEEPVQTPEVPGQLEQDQAQCYSIAVETTGYDPAQVSSADTSTEQEPARGGRVAGAAAGAAVGATRAEIQGQRYDNYDRVPDEVQQEYRRDRAGDAALAGAVIGGSSQRRANRELEQQQAAAEQASNDAANAFDQAYEGCMAGRGY